MEKISKNKKKMEIFLSYNYQLISIFFNFNSLSFIMIIILLFKSFFVWWFFFWLEEELYGAIYGRSGAQLGAPVGPGTFSETFI